ncbi:glycosyltransferase family 4 protein [Rubrivirga marina]|uniref:Uncharacterized protein n=1 Tax=Rubrivirga marina TaxID=1196024 RepID=A0A271IZ60_9BACT|nr:glycosyltransferase family 4 protein [Rubrivirga marina]PAP76541.1 hypothetical protein BSZ37_08850 [Rubrivirga marina]
MFEPSSPRRVCLVWPRLGPYHLARVRGAHERFARDGGEAVALDVATDDRLYEWEVEREPTPFRREVAFPGRVFEDLSPSQIQAGVTAALNRIDPDAVAVSSYSTPDARAVVAWCRRHRRTAVMLYDSRAVDAARSPLREAVKRTLVRQFDSCFASGAEHGAYAIDLGIPPEAVVTGMNVVNNAAFAAGAEAARQAPERWRDLPGLDEPSVPFFLASNRFIRRKNLPALVRAYAAYRARAETGGPLPWPLVLLGDGERRDELERLAGDGVVFAGFQQAAVLPAYYGLAGAFVHPALNDQWGLVVNEAAAAGLPLLISTGTGAAADLVEVGRNGYTFPPTDETALTEAMLRLAMLSDEERTAFGAHSRALVSRFTPETYGEGLHKAVRLGEPRSDRGLSLAARAVLWALRVGARDASSFHTVEA